MGRWIRTTAVAAALALAAGGGRAQDRPPLEAYGALPALEQVGVSPSGERLAFVTVVGDERAIVIAEVGANARLGAAALGDTKLRYLDWIGEDRVLAGITTTDSIPALGIGMTEFQAGGIYSIPDQSIRWVFRDDRNLLPFMIGAPVVRATPDGHAIFVRGYAPSEAAYLNLFRVDPADGAERVVVNAGHDVEDFVLDAEGRPLARADYDERTRRWTLLLARENGRLGETWSTVTPVDSPALFGLGRTPRTIVVEADREDIPRAEGQARSHLFEVSLDTGEWTRLPLPAADGLVHHPRTHLLIGGAAVGDEGMSYHFTDPAAARTWRIIEQAFEERRPELVSWSDDFSRVMVFTSGSGDSGTYQLIDLAAGAASVVGRAYPDILPENVGAVRSIRYHAADGVEIHGYLTLPPGVEEPRGLPLVVLAHGGPAVRDVMEFDWWAQALASRGYAVLQPNFRGSAGYGDRFLEAGYGEWGRKMQTDLSDGVRWLASEGAIDPARVCIVGSSYGGYAALAGPTLDPGVYRCAVSVAGVSDLRRMVLREAEQGVRRNNQTVRYWNRFMGGDGPGDRDLDQISPARQASRADAPILLLHGRDDTVVPIEQSRIMASALRAAGKPHELIELAGEDHWLSRPATRQRMLTETVRFLKENNPAP
jgi:dipeptidyl aminopeptidase/acylaminoacyl peptidase